MAYAQKGVESEEQKIKKFFSDMGASISSERAEKIAYDKLNSFLNRPITSVTFILNEANCRAIAAYSQKERSGTAAKIEKDKNGNYYVLTLTKESGGAQKATLDVVPKSVFGKAAVGGRSALKMTEREKQAHENAERFIAKNKWMLEFAGSSAEKVRAGIYLFFLEHDVSQTVFDAAVKFMSANKDKIIAAREAVMESKGSGLKRFIPAGGSSKEQIAEMVLGPYFVQAFYGIEVKLTSLVEAYESNWRMTEFQGCYSQFQIRKGSLEDFNRKVKTGLTAGLLQPGISVASPVNAAKKFGELKSNAFYATIAAAQIMAAKFIDIRYRPSIVSGDTRKIIDKIGNISELKALSHEEKSIFYRDLAMLYNGNKEPAKDKNGSIIRDRNGNPITVMHQYKTALYMAYKNGTYVKEPITWLGAFSALS